jgi:hypothetical protein
MCREGLQRVFPRGKEGETDQAAGRQGRETEEDMAEWREGRAGVVEI